MGERQHPLEAGGAKYANTSHKTYTGGSAGGGDISAPKPLCQHQLTPLYSGSGRSYCVLQGTQFRSSHKQNTPQPGRHHSRYTALQNLPVGNNAEYGAPDVEDILRALSRAPLQGSPPSHLESAGDKRRNITYTPTFPEHQKGSTPLSLSPPPTPKPTLFVVLPLHRRGTDNRNTKLRGLKLLSPREKRGQNS